MSDLTDFLLARIAEDEAVAQRAGTPPWDEWRYDEGGEVYHAETARRSPGSGYLNGVTNDTEGLSPAVDDSVGPHIARHDPARVLAECEAKRRIIESPLSDAARRLSVRAPFDNWTDDIDRMLRLLALPYADHEDFRPEWAV